MSNNYPLPPEENQFQASPSYPQPVQNQVHIDIDEELGQAQHQPYYNPYLPPHPPNHQGIHPQPDFDELRKKAEEQEQAGVSGH